MTQETERRCGIPHFRPSAPDCSLFATLRQQQPPSIAFSVCLPLLPALIKVAVSWCPLCWSGRAADIHSPPKPLSGACDPGVQPHKWRGRGGQLLLLPVSSLLDSESRIHLPQNTKQAAAHYEGTAGNSPSSAASCLVSTMAWLRSLRRRSATSWSSSVGKDGAMGWSAARRNRCARLSSSSPLALDACTYHSPIAGPGAQGQPSDCESTHIRMSCV